MTESMYRNKRVVITGAAGTVGSALTNALLRNELSELVAVDNNESALHELHQESTAMVSPALCDVRDYERVREATKNSDVIFHCAALKHVPLCERNPTEAIKTNIEGVRNVIAAAKKNEVECVLFTSSDKAASPTNVMGTSKLMGEYLIRAANIPDEDQRFVSTRFGNVLGSRGSVVPIFRQQIRDNGPITLTSPDMTRFVMSLDEAVSLVLEAGVMGVGGEIVVGKMRAIDVRTLAEVMIEALAPSYGLEKEAIAITEIGPREGEKFYEELMSPEEVRRSLELEKHHVILPPFFGLYPKIQEKYGSFELGEYSRPYNSDNEIKLTKKELTKYLEASDLLS